MNMNMINPINNFLQRIHQAGYQNVTEADLIGEGTSAYVFRYEDPQTHQFKALKCFKCFKNDKDKDWFTQEQSIQEYIRHHFTAEERRWFNLAEQIHDAQQLIVSPYCLPLNRNTLQSSHYPEILEIYKILYRHHIYEADLKPDNFLLLNNHVVVGDLGGFAIPGVSNGLKSKFYCSPEYALKRSSRPTANSFAYNFGMTVLDLKYDAFHTFANHHGGNNIEAFRSMILQQNCSIMEFLELPIDPKSVEYQFYSRVLSPDVEHRLSFTQMCERFLNMIRSVNA